MVYDWVDQWVDIDYLRLIGFGELESDITVRRKCALT